MGVLVHFQKSEIEVDLLCNNKSGHSTNLLVRVLFLIIGLKFLTYPNPPPLLLSSYSLCLRVKKPTDFTQIMINLQAEYG